MKICVHKKDLYKNVHKDVRYNSPELEIIQRSISRWMDEQIEVCSQNEMLPVNKKEWTIVETQ